MMADEGGRMVDFIGMRKDEMIWNDRYLWIFSIRRSVHGRVVRKWSQISKQTNRPYFAIAIPLGFCTWLVTLSIHTSPLYKPPYPTSLNTQQSPRTPNQRCADFPSANSPQTSTRACTSACGSGGRTSKSPVLLLLGPCLLGENNSYQVKSRYMYIGYVCLAWNVTLLQLYLYCMRISSLHPLSSQYRHVYINLAPQKPLQLNPAVRHRNFHKTNSILSRLFNFNHFPTSTKILLKNIMKYHQSSNRPEQKNTNQPNISTNQPNCCRCIFLSGTLATCGWKSTGSKPWKRFPNSCCTKGHTR